MNNSLQKTILSGFAATVVMTVVTYLAPMMGLPKMSVPEMLSGMTGFPIVVGWIMHFMIGTIFAFGYSFLFAPFVKIQNLVVKGAVFGFTVFIFAQIAMAMMNLIMGVMPAPKGGMMLMIIGSIIGHIMYGISVALIAKPQQ